MVIHTPSAASANRTRRSARIILLDEIGRVLLIRFLISRLNGDYGFWATPGGEIEFGEEAADAAARELKEELGLVLPLSGPVHQATGVFEFRQEVFNNVDTFYVARFPGGVLDLVGVDDDERSVLKEIRWWSAEDIDAAVDPIYPPDIADAVRRLSCE